MDKFWELVQESTIVQGLLTLGIWGAVIYLAVIQQPVPDLLSTGGVAILGFWFGSKSTAAAMAVKSKSGS